jgi:hypothetical protein
MGSNTKFLNIKSWLAVALSWSRIVLFLCDIDLVSRCELCCWNSHDFQQRNVDLEQMYARGVHRRVENAITH